MPVALYPHTPTGAAHPAGYYIPDYCPAPLHNTFGAGPPGSSSSSHRGLPYTTHHTGNSIPGSHNGGPIQRSHSGAPIPGSHINGPALGSLHGGMVPGSQIGGPVQASRSGVHIPESQIRGPLPVPHHGTPVLGCHNGGPQIPETQSSLTGPHGQSPVGGAHNGLPIQEVQVSGCHNGGPISGRQNGCQVPEAGPHTDGMLSGPQRESVAGGPHSVGVYHRGSSGVGEPLGDNGGLVTPYYSGGPHGGGPQASSHNTKHMRYSPAHGYPQPAPVLDHHGVPYVDPRGPSTYLGSQYSSYGTPPDPGLSYELGVYQQPAGMQPCQAYHKACRPGSQYTPYIHPTKDQQQQQQQEQVSPQCSRSQVEHSSLNVTTKVEPDTDWWQDGELDRFQQIHLHSDDPPAREYTKPRRRRRNSEKRKEKSRDAARCRREKESEIFTELANTLPLPAQTISQLDKASVMRLTLAFLKTRALCQAGFSKTNEGGTTKLDVEWDCFLLKALDGFLLVLSTDGDIVYTSDNIVAFLGIPQVDVMGQSLYEYTHPCDHEEVRELLMAKDTQELRLAFLRLKCTLTAKGRSVNLKSASYKVVQVSGELVGGEDQSWLVALGTPVPHPSNIEFPLDKQTFVSKHSLDMKFTYVDDNVGEFCGYDVGELMGRSLYELHHALDSEMVKDAYKTLRSKGQVETGRYRFLARGGGYVWLVTQATLIHGPKDHKPQYVVCLNYVVSGVESAGEILSELQLMCSSSNSSCSSSSSSASKVSNKASAATIVAPPVARSIATPTVPLAKSDKQAKVGEVTSGTGVRVTPAPPPRPPVAATFKIFAPRTEDMNKGYLMFSDDDPKCTVLKEEPEDLTHLAPSGGDTCVPLSEVPTLIPYQDGSCMLQEVSTLIPDVDNMFTLDYQMPITNSDVLISSQVPDNSEEQEDTTKYLYDEHKLNTGFKCLNSLSGGKIVEEKSGCSTPSSDCGLSSPEPLKPLLSQAALSPVPERKQNTVVFGSSRPRTTTESLFTQLDESHTTGSSTDALRKLDLKLEEQNMDSDEFEMRAPFIPLSNELLMLGPDDLLWGAEPEPLISPKHNGSSNRDLKCSHVISDKDESNLAQLLRDTDPPITGSGQGRSLQIERSASNQRSQYQQSKFLDGGGNFVDPNKVLPGHSGGKDELDGTSCSTLLADPPPVMVQETVDPPPPLLTVDAQHVSLPLKRVHSPNSSPLLNHKKLCSPSCQQQQSRDELMQQQSGGLRLLATPYAPTMQQLLVSKEPITVRGGRPGGGISASQNTITNKSHSVLRNLLNVSDDGHIVIGEPQPGSSGLAPKSVRLPREKVATMLLTGNGGIHTDGQVTYPKLRLVTGRPGALMQAGHFALKLATNPNGQFGQNLVKRGRKQDPLLLVDPETTIPNLLDLTQQDYEVNAPANNCSLLQGADLLMALDQSP